MSQDTGTGLVVFATGFAAGSIAAGSDWATMATVARDLEPVAHVAVPAIVLGATAFVIKLAWRHLRRLTLADYELDESDLEREARERNRETMRAMIHHSIEHPLVTKAPHLAYEWAQRDADAGRCAFCGKELT